MSQDEKLPDPTGDRSPKPEASALERMLFPANMGWFEGDTEPVEVVIIMTLDHYLMRLIIDTDVPWASREVIAGLLPSGHSSEDGTEKDTGSGNTGRNEDGPNGEEE
jgi:hypothetical protein